MGICQWEKNMKNAKASERFVQNLLLVMPDWHSKLVKPFRDTLDNEMSLETYYCLETLRACGTATMSELAHKLKVPKQQMTKLVDRLSQSRFVERVQGTEDVYKRQILVCRHIRRETAMTGAPRGAAAPVMEES